MKTQLVNLKVWLALLLELLFPPALGKPTVAVKVQILWASVDRQVCSTTPSCETEKPPDFVKQAHISHPASGHQKLDHIARAQALANQHAYLLGKAPEA